MKTEPAQPAYPITLTREIEQFELGLSKRELIALEFAKTLLGLRDYQNQQVYDLSKKVASDYEFATYTKQEDADKFRHSQAESLMDVALYAADKFIEALNK